ncbi:YcxB family protein [Kitasatospora sp. RB6PN24]|uniref:YcxB family protein n=1 Tax=Kitasatospora humi TaxID=2893891 RepID=UPI001E37DEAB|nr:YcxB family protein [Kitasatospora humi]MCC9308349.1 YcxB family protein [Kitasatospora humi]
MDITGTYQLTAEQMYRGLRAGLRGRFLRVRITLALLALCGLLSIVVGGTPIGVGLLIGVAFLGIWQPIATKRSLARSLERDPSPVVAAFTEQGCSFTKAQSRSEFAWERFQKITQNPEFLLFQPSKVVVIPVPKAAFTPEQNAELTAFLQRLPSYSAA